MSPLEQGSYAVEVAPVAADMDVAVRRRELSETRPAACVV